MGTLEQFFFNGILSIACFHVSWVQTQGHTRIPPCSLKTCVHAVAPALLVLAVALPIGRGPQARQGGGSILIQFGCQVMTRGRVQESKGVVHRGGREVFA